MKCHTALVVVGLACYTLAAPATVEPQILKNLQAAETTNVLVTFKKADSKAALARFDSLASTLTSRNTKLTTIYNILKNHTETVQADVISVLKKSQAKKKHDLRQLWMSAEVIVRHCDIETVELLRNHPDVKSLVAEKFFPLEPIEARELLPFEIRPQSQWGVNKIHAEEVWNAGNHGNGVVVANIDTGVRYTHTALRSNYRGTLAGNHDYSWYAPNGRTETPSDTNGHGTHTIGTIVGTINGIGVAPGAIWITCKGCSGNLCSSFDLLECGNWMACPTKTNGAEPLCGMAPHLVSNSWNSQSQGDNFYDSVIPAWTRVGIAPIFSSGSSGPGCRSITSPADRPGTIAVSATDSRDHWSIFSSVGYCFDGKLAPVVAAPGVDIFSASSLSDTGYATMSGASMACPHVAGLAALIYSKNPFISVAKLRTALKTGAQPINVSGLTCQGVSDAHYPNYHVGFGRIDAVASVNAA